MASLRPGPAGSSGDVSVRRLRAGAQTHTPQTAPIESAALPESPTTGTADSGAVPRKGRPRPWPSVQKVQAPTARVDFPPAPDDWVEDQAGSGYLLFRAFGIPRKRTVTLRSSNCSRQLQPSLASNTVPDD